MVVQKARTFCLNYIEHASKRRAGTVDATGRLPVGWRRSRKGNPFREVPDGGVVTVFERKTGKEQGMFSYVCNDAFCRDSFLTEEEAMEAAGDEYGF